VSPKPCLTDITPEGLESVADYPKAIEDCLAQIKEAGHIVNERDLAAVGFKTVIAKGVTGCVRLDERVLGAMEAFNGLAPAHNPPYITGIRLFGKRMPGVPLVGLFETAFHQTVPMSRQVYGIPHEWTEKLGIRQGDLIDIASRQGTLRVPAFPSPGIAPDVVAMPAGQGHDNFTRYATGRGSNPISILAPVAEPETGALAWAATRVKITRVADADGSLVLFAGSLRDYPPEHPHR